MSATEEKEKERFNIFNERREEKRDCIPMRSRNECCPAQYDKPLLHLSCSVRN